MDKQTMTRPLSTCLQLNAIALGFSLTHATIDFSLVFQAFENDIGPSDVVPFLLGQEWLVGAFAATMALAYGWWGWSLARAGRDGKSGLVSLLLLSFLWAGGNGASIVICPPPCGGVTPYKLYPDVSHLGSLIFGALAAYMTWQVIRANRDGYGNRGVYNPFCRLVRGHRLEAVQAGPKALVLPLDAGETQL